MSNQKNQPQSLLGTIWEYTRIIATALILALTIRFFLVEPYKIPSSSMVPTLLIGDYLFVNKLAYNIRIPFTDVFFREVTPAKGDIIVFKRKVDHLPGSWFGFGNTYFIKRVVATEGDRIAYVNKKLYVNGEPSHLEPLGPYTYDDSAHSHINASLFNETISGYSHHILLTDTQYSQNVAQTVVPEGKIVVVGDNRDNSGDSRLWNAPDWGYVPQHDVLGRAEFIFFSLGEGFAPRMERMFNSLHPENADDNLTPLTQ